MTVRSMLPASRRPSRFTVFALGFGAVLACFCILSWNHSAKAGEDNFEVVPFADEIGQEFSPAVSPDGQRIAYVWDGNGYNYDIYIKEVHKGTVARLTHDSSPDLDPAWSPDGTMLVYLRVLPDRVRVLAEAATGGPERVITETASPISGWGADSNPYFGCYGPAWSSDASRIVVTDRGTSGHGFALFSVSLKSGARTELTHPSGEARLSGWAPHRLCTHHQSWRQRYPPSLRGWRRRQATQVRWPRNSGIELDVRRGSDPLFFTAAWLVPAARDQCIAWRGIQSAASRCYIGR